MHLQTIWKYFYGIVFVFLLLHSLWLRFLYLACFSFLKFEYLIYLLVYFLFGVSSLFHILYILLIRNILLWLSCFLSLFPPLETDLIFASCDCINILFSFSALLNGVAELCTFFRFLLLLSITFCHCSYFLFVCCLFPRLLPFFCCSSSFILLVLSVSYF